MSAPIGNLEKVLRILLEKAKISTDLKNFQNCKDDYERVKHLQTTNNLIEFDWIEKYFESCHELHQKSVEKAASERLAGNKLFQKKQYREAVNSYTHAIIQGPAKTEELAMAYGNRSAAWFYMGEFDNCLKDISEAIKNGYPASTLYKLHLRSAHCNFHQGKIPEASEDLGQLSLLLTEDTALPDRRKAELQRDADDLKMKISKINYSTQIVTEEDSMVPDLSYGANSVLVQASTAIDLRCNKSKGRFLVANRDIKAGDTLIVERPYAAILLPDHYSTHCHHCFLSLQTVFPCRQCTVVRYCSPECEEESWLSFHRIECPYLDLLHSIGIAHLSLRIILVAGLGFLIDFRNSLKNGNTLDRIAGLTDSGKYERNYLTVHDLMTHTEDMNIEDLYQYSVTAVLLLRILQHSKWFNSSGSRMCESETQKPETNHSIDCHNDVKEMDLNLLNKLNDKKASQNGVNSTQGGVNSAQGGVNSAQGVTFEQSGVNSAISSEPAVSSNCLDNAKGNFCHNNESTNTNNSSKRILDHICDKMASQHTLSDLNGTEIYIGGLLLCHIQQLVCNAHAITEVKVTESGEQTLVQETSQVRVATAIYPTASLMNHSCDPTIISSFHKDILVVRAVKDVKSGEEIYNCYGPHHKRMKRGERQQSLRDQYFFTCTCDPCTDSKDEDLIYASYSCPECKGPLCPTTDKKLKCRHCQHISNSLESIEEEARLASQLFSNGLQLLQQEKYKDAISVMLSCYKKRAKLLYKHNSVLAETQDCLARCYAMTGQFKKAAKYLQESIATIRVIYGPQSIELANELRKLSEVLISARDWRQALDVTGEAITLFTLHYGKRHETVRDLCEAQSELRSVV